MCPKHKGRPELNYAFIKKKLYEGGGCNRRAENFPMPSREQVIKTLGTSFSINNIKSFLDELDNLCRECTRLPKGWVYLGIVGLASFFRDIRPDIFPSNKPTWRKLMRLKGYMEWFKAHFKPGQTFNCDDPKITCDSLTNLEVSQLIIGHHSHYVGSSLVRRGRGFKPNHFYRMQVLSLVLDLVTDGGLGPDRAYTDIAELIEKLTGAIGGTTQRMASLRALATAEAKRILQLKPIPKDFPQKRRKS